MITLSQALSRIHIATILILLLAIVGAILVLSHGLDWSQYYKDISLASGGLAIGRGLAAKGVN